MSIQKRYWRVIFNDLGKVLDIVEIDFKDGKKDWLIVEADDLKEAKVKAVRLYCARKKKLAKERLHAQGRCACGRKQDRKHRSGVPILTCTVCSVRQKACLEKAQKRVASGDLSPAVRDEAARVASNLARQRDRRAEIRLETLLEVRNQWIKSRTIGSYGKWLEQEIEKLVANDTRETA